MNGMHPFRNQRGVAILEMVVVLPLLLLVLFATVEFSRAWLTVNLTVTASREAARAGVVAPPDSFPDPATAIQKINDLLGAGNWTGSVTCSANPCAPDEQVQATVTVPFQTVIPGFLPWLTSLSLQQTTRMRYE